MESHGYASEPSVGILDVSVIIYCATVFSLKIRYLAWLDCTQTNWRVLIFIRKRIRIGK